MNGGGGGGPCGACKLLRRKCVKGCVFAPYFEPDQRGTLEFEAVHRVFGARNVANLLLRTPPTHRTNAVISLSYEALSRIRDPVYGCVAHLKNLHQQVDNLQAQLAYVQARLSILKEYRRRSTNCIMCDYYSPAAAAAADHGSVDFGQIITSTSPSSCFSSGEPAILMFNHQEQTNHAPSSGLPSYIFDPSKPN